MLKLVRNALAATLSGVLATAVSAAVIPLPSNGLLEDDNIEYITDADGNVKTSGTLQVGDLLHAFINMDKVLDSANNTIFDFSSSPRELVGYSVIEVASIVGNRFFFKPNAAFEATYGSGAMAVLFTEVPDDFSIGCTSIASCLSAATDGDEWITVGFEGPGDYWEALVTLPTGAGTDLAVIGSLPSGTTFAQATYGLSVLENYTGYVFGELTCPLCTLYGGPTGDTAQITGSGSLLGGAGLARPFIARSDFDFNFAAVPEPGTLALLGLALAGMGVAGRRRQSA